MVAGGKIVKQFSKNLKAQYKLVTNAEKDQCDLIKCD